MLNWVRRKRWLVLNIVLVGILASLLGFSVIDEKDAVDRSVKIGVGNEKVITLGHIAYAAGDVDYTYDGTDDNVQFQLALNALPATGGRLVDVSAVQKNFSATVTRAIANVTIIGSGYGSYFVNDGVTALFSAGGNGWKFEDLRTDAGGINMGATTGWQWIYVDNGSTAYDFRTPAGSMVNGAYIASSITNTGLTSGRIPITGAGGLFGDDADLTWTGGNTLNTVNVNLTGTVTLANNQYLRLTDNTSVANNILLMNQNNDTFLHGYTDRVLYVARNNAIEVSFFGGGTGSSRFLTSYWDSDAALVADVLVNSPTIYLRNGVWSTDSNANRFLGSAIQSISTASGAAAAQAGYLSMGYGAFNGDTYVGGEHLRLNQAAGPAYSMSLLQDTDIASGKHFIPSANNTSNLGATTSGFASLFFPSIRLAEAGNILNVTNQAGDTFRGIGVNWVALYANLQGYADGVDIRTGGTDSWELKFMAMDNDTDAHTEVASLVNAAAPYFKLTQPPMFSTNTTGSKTTSLGSNNPATDNTTPYTWLTVISGDGSTVYIPAWK